MLRCDKLNKDTRRFLLQLIGKTIGEVLNGRGVAGPMRRTYYSFAMKMWGIICHGGGQEEINNAIRDYQDGGADPNILRIIADVLQGKPTTEQG